MVKFAPRDAEISRIFVLGTHEPPKRMRKRKQFRQSPSPKAEGRITTPPLGHPSPSHARLCAPFRSERSERRNLRQEPTNAINGPP